ncbi:MAG: hypothetical protein HY320_01810 [Armatimonadetes bacterium]|nr:hypothetical protein [Armatimonadota bacterium]
MWLLLLALVSFVRVGLAPPLASAPSGEAILRRAAQAFRRVPYQGRRLTTLWLEHRTEGIECVEYADGRGRSRVEYLAPRSARGRVIIDDGRNHWQVEPGGHRVFRVDASPLEAEAAWEIPLLMRNYTVALAPGRHVVARRDAYKLLLRPKHAGKPHETLWVDRWTYLVLRREARHADGAPARWTTFTDITYHPNTPPARFEFRPPPHARIDPAPSPERQQDVLAAQRFIGAPYPFPQRLPSLGFERHAALCRDSAGKRTVHLLYDDGIATLSVFMDRQGNHDSIRQGRRVWIGGQPAWLKTDHHFAVLRWAARGLRYTVVGDLTVDALLKVAHDLNAAR